MSFSFLSCTLGSILSFSFPFSFFFQIFLHPWHLSFSHGNLMSASSTAVQRAILCFSLTDFNRPDFDLVAHQLLLKFSLVPEYLYTRTVPLLHFLPSWFSVCRSFLSLFSRFASAMALPMPCPQPPFTSFPASSFVQSFWVIWLSLLVPSVDVHLLTASNSGFFFFFPLDSRYLPGTLKWTASLDAQERLMASCLQGSFLFPSQICPVFLSSLHVHSCSRKIRVRSLSLVPPYLGTPSSPEVLLLLVP